MDFLLLAKRKSQSTESCMAWNVHQELEDAFLFLSLLLHFLRLWSIFQLFLFILHNADKTYLVEKYGSALVFYKD